jgi:hypothetical protein
MDHSAPAWYCDLACYRLVARGCLLLAASLLSGCFRAYTTVYPPAWPQAKAIPAETCPDIAGRYLNAGIGSPGWYSNMKHFCTGFPEGWRRRPSWICDTSLGQDLVDDPLFRAARAIEIQQPDPATLLISIADDPSIQPRTLSLGHGDFKCDASGLTMSSVGSDYDALNTVVSVLVLHFGIASSSRSFRPLGNGSLLMDVTNEHVMTQEIVATGTIKGQGFVRWDRDTGENAGAPQPGGKGSACHSSAECNGELICAADICVEYRR